MLSLILLLLLSIIHLTSAHSLAELESAVTSSLRFGTFRPGLLHGVSSTNKDVEFKSGVLWMPFRTFKDLDHLRHECEMKDRLHYDYLFNNPFRGSQQVINDGRLKVISNFEQTKDGFSVQLVFNGNDQSTAHSFIYYIYADSIDQDIINKEWSYRVGHKSANVDYERRVLLRMPKEFEPHRIKDVLKNHFQGRLYKNHEAKLSIEPKDVFVLEPGSEKEGNLLLIQVVFKASANFGLELFSGENPPQAVGVKKLFQDFSKRFDVGFALKSHKFYGRYINFARTTFSNVLGGIGYFSGNAVISSTVESSITNSTQLRLLSCSPSRPFFPRGFLWDEGFHLLIMSKIYPSLTVYMLKNWLDLMDDNGWIMREVILGNEARARVPPEFQLQYADYANPPTLILPLIKIIDVFEKGSLVNKFSSNTCADAKSDALYAMQKSDLQKLIRPLYEKYRKNFLWLRNSQKATLHISFKKKFEEVYRWRGQTEGHCLASGLDDYPRGRPTDFELHVDLLAWVGFYADSISKLAKFLDISSKEYLEIANNVKHSLNEVFWSSKSSMFADVSFENESYHHVIHNGYVSLTPFLFQLASNDRINDYLKQLKDLLSVCGVRSLASADQYYGSNEDYWRGKVWLNFNYLILRSLKLYYWHINEAREIYSSIRGNVIACMYSVWEDYGYVYEQYSDREVKGTRSRPFNGWSALIVLIMSEYY